MNQNVRDPKFLAGVSKHALAELLSQGRISPNDARIAEGLGSLSGHDDLWPLQSRVLPWMLACFGPTIPFDKTERNHRFLEEALELVQSIGCTQSEAHQLVDYVYGRPAGEPSQEVGGVMVTLAALCIAVVKKQKP